MNTTLKQRSRAKKVRQKVASTDNAFVTATKDSVRQVIQEEVTPRLDNLDAGFTKLETGLGELDADLKGIKAEAQQTNKLLQQLIELQEHSQPT